MPDRQYTITKVSEKPPEEWSFQKDGNTVTLLTFWIKIRDGENQERPVRLHRSPKTKPPKPGDTLYGEIIEEERGARLKIRQEVGRTGQRDNPREIRANMAVKTAFEAAVKLYGGTTQEFTYAEEFTRAWASRLYDMAAALSEQKSRG